MNEQLKKRLVGATVLVALAVIFLPMLLEGDKHAGVSMLGSNVPDVPGSTAGVVDIPLQIPPPPAAAPAVVENTMPPVPEPTAEAPAAAPEPVAAAPAPQPLPPTPVPPVAPTKPVKPVKPAEVPPPVKTGAAESWAVQVGSFGEAANASRLRDTLRAKGYPAYVEQVKRDSGNSYRVRVGPVLSRADAEAIQAKLAKIDHRGIVVPHP